MRFNEKSATIALPSVYRAPVVARVSGKSGNTTSRYVEKHHESPARSRGIQKSGAVLMITSPITGIFGRV